MDHAANYHPLSVSVSERGKARSILQEHCIDALPVLNKRGIITDIIFAHGLDLDNRKQVDIPVVMMAGGLGTRLYPYTKILPKPLIPVGEQPIAELIMDRFRDFGCHNFTMIVNYKKGMIKSYFNELEKNYTVDFADEEVFMGTGGGLCLLKGKVDMLPNGAIVVDDYMQASAPGVYAAGDSATVFYNPTGQHDYIPLATNAVRQGLLVGRNIETPTVKYMGTQATSAVQRTISRSPPPA